VGFDTGWICWLFDIERNILGLLEHTVHCVFFGTTSSTLSFFALKDQM